MIILLETLKEVSNAIIDFTLDACARHGYMLSVCVWVFCFVFILYRN